MVLSKTIHSKIIRAGGVFSQPWPPVSYYPKDTMNIVFWIIRVTTETTTEMGVICYNRYVLSKGHINYLRD